MTVSLLLVALGGACGASLRFLIGLAVAFPYGTLFVNVAGSFAMGLLAASLLARGGAAAPFVLSGLLGGFTTFSTFSLDVLRLAETGRGGAALAYAGGSVILSVGACAVGAFLARVWA